MKQANFSWRSPQWYCAIPLSERIALLSVPIIERELNTDLAQGEMQQWQSQLCFSQEPSLWTKWLLKNQITEAQFLELLGESTTSLQARFSQRPTWLTEFITGLSHQNFSYVTSEIHGELTEVKVNLGFLHVIEPLLKQALVQLNQEIRSLIAIKQHIPFQIDKIGTILLAGLPDKLLVIMSRTMVLELHVARLQGLLTDETSSERFHSFIKRLQQQEVAFSLFLEYPVLAQQVKIVIDHWLRFSLEFIDHLCSDWEAICQTFSPENNSSMLVSLRTGKGDTHRGGRSVIVAEFNSGLKIVYKPRNLSVYLHFQNLLTWLNERGNHHHFHTLKILNCNNHGWVEFVESQSCNTGTEIERFYQRQGGYLAILHLLEAVDFHSENLIACGEHPILIDLETLFDPYRIKQDNQEAETQAGLQMAYSVLRVGLLPQKILGNNESEGIDISGLGGFPGQLTPQNVSTWEGSGTDEMKLKKQRVEIPTSQNRPQLNGNDINTLDYAEFIVTGFTEIYQLIQKYRDELLADYSPLNDFANDEIRIVLRYSHTYFRILWESFHPDLLRNALERDKFYAHLWLEIIKRPEMEQVILAELEDLWQNDIPIFTTYANSLDLWTSKNQQIPNFFMQSGIAMVQQRLQHLNQQDIHRQTWFIRAAFASLENGDQQHQQSSRYLVTELKPIDVQPEMLREKILHHAGAIADYLAASAVHGKDDVTWLGLTQINQKQWSIVSLDPYLYDGISGVVLFLAYLNKLTGNNRDRLLAEAALKTLQNQLKKYQSAMRTIGAFSGLGGIIHTLTHIGMLWKKPELISQAEELVQLLPPLISEDEHFDIITGAAGCIGSLISLYRCHPHEQILAVAKQCGYHLINQAQSTQSGLGWIIRGLAKQPLTGFSHGTAGIAWALLQLYSLTGEKSFYQTALDALNYERNFFCTELGNWLDIRQLDNEKLQDSAALHNCLVNWCYGASGIGLARLHSLPYLEDLILHREINTAIKTTLAQGFGFNHSLCHGDLGNLELILEAGIILNNSEYQTQVNYLSTMMINSIEQHGWICAVPLGVKTPGLMTGLAGIGYGLLRLAEPRQIPSVLMLQPGNW